MEAEIIKVHNTQGELESQVTLKATDQVRLAILRFGIYRCAGMTITTMASEMSQVRVLTRQENMSTMIFTSLSRSATRKKWKLQETKDQSEVIQYLNSDDNLVEGKTMSKN